MVVMMVSKVSPPLMVEESFDILKEYKARLSVSSNPHDLKE